MNYNLGYNGQPQSQFSGQTNFQNFQQQQMPQQTQFFLSPQGSTFIINSSNELNSIPAGAGITAAICLKENLLYIKTLQNGIPATIGYQLCALGSNGVPQENESAQIKLNEEFDNRFQKYEERLKKLEEALVNKTKGGVAQWPL